MKVNVVKSSVVILSLAFSIAVFAQDKGAGATTYKTKCAMCHGPNGEGKSGPALKGTSVSESDIVAMLTKGKEGKKAPHSKAISGLTEEQAKAVAAHVKSLK